MEGEWKKLQTKSRKVNYWNPREQGGVGVDYGPAACDLSFLHEFVQLMSHDIQIGKFLKLFSM